MDYRRTDKKGKLWQDQGKTMGKSVEHLQGWFKSLRDTNTRLDRKKSGDGASELTQRERWVKANFNFLKSVVRHHAEPVKSISINKTNIIVIKNHSISIFFLPCIFALYFCLVFY